MAHASTIDTANNIAKLEVKLEAEWRKCKDNIDYWIETYVKIQNVDDAEGTPMPFILWDEQKKALKTFVEERCIIVLKARQLGLTWLGLSYLVHELLFMPGFSAVCISRKEEPEAKELIQRCTFILEHLPNWQTRNKKDKTQGYLGPQWDSQTLRITMEHPNKAVSRIQSLSSAPSSGRTFTATCILLDEWAFQEADEEIWSSIYPIANRPTGGKVIGISTMRLNTVFHDQWDRAMSGENRFTPVFLPWTSDPRRDEEWYEETKDNMPNSYLREYPASPEEAKSVGVGAFFPEIDFENVHLFRTFEIQPDWSIVGSYDPGYATRACFKWYQISPEGWAVCFREFYPQRMIDSEQAEEILKMSTWPAKAGKKAEPYDFEYIVADPSAWVPASDSGKSTAETFSDAGLYMERGSKDIDNGWRLLHQWLKPRKGSDHSQIAMLRFTPSCMNTIRTYPACEQSKTNPDDISRSSEHHPQDCDRYFVMSRPEPKIIKEPEKVPVTFSERVWEKISRERKDRNFDPEMGSEF